MGQQSPKNFNDLDSEDDAREFAERWRRNLLLGIWAVVTGDKAAYRKFKKQSKVMFPEPTEEEIQQAMEATPENMRWWAAVERDPAEDETRIACKQCGRRIDSEKIKQCPNCKVVLHARCYDDSMGGYETPGCQCCRTRCYTR